MEVQSFGTKRQIKGARFVFFFFKRLLVFFYDNVKEIMTVNSYWALVTQ